MSVKELVKSYVQLTGDKGIITESFASIAQKTGVSVATVFRAVHEMEKEQVLNIVHSSAKAKPDTIVLVDKLQEESLGNIKTDNSAIFAKILLKRLKVKQDIINHLQQELQYYLNSSEIAKIYLPGDIEAIFRYSKK